MSADRCVQSMDDVGGPRLMSDDGYFKGMTDDRRPHQKFDDRCVKITNDRLSPHLKSDDCYVYEKGVATAYV